MDTGEIRVEALLDSMTQLMELYSRESEMIARRDRAGILGLVDTKDRLARAHEEAVRAIARDPESVPQLSPERMEHLHATTAAFIQASFDNAAAVQVAIGATEALAGTIVEAINRARALEEPTSSMAPPGYGRFRTPPAGRFNEVL